MQTDPLIFYMPQKTVQKTQLEEELILKVEPVLSNLGYECRDIEAGQSLVRVTLDKANREALSIDDCSNVHRVLGPMFDVWDPIPGNYTLEISSPGEKPRMRTLEHFKEACGEKIKFQTPDGVEVAPPAKPRKNWEGDLVSVSEDRNILLRDHDGVEQQISIDQIKNAVWLRVWKP